MSLAPPRATCRVTKMPPSGRRSILSLGEERIETLISSAEPGPGLSEN